MSPVLEEIERRLSELTPDEKLHLIQRLTRDVRGPAVAHLAARCADLEAMANDPEVQREIREIDEEFAVTLTDGLENR